MKKLLKLMPCASSAHSPVVLKTGMMPAVMNLRKVADKRLRVLLEANVRQAKVAKLLSSRKVARIGYFGGMRGGACCSPDKGGGGGSYRGGGVFYTYSAATESGKVIVINNCVFKVEGNNLVIPLDEVVKQMALNVVEKTPPIVEAIEPHKEEVEICCFIVKGKAWEIYGKTDEMIHLELQRKFHKATAKAFVEYLMNNEEKGVFDFLGMGHNEIYQELVRYYGIPKRKKEKTFTRECTFLDWKRERKK